MSAATVGGTVDVADDAAAALQSELLEVARTAAEAGAKVLLKYFGKVSALATKSTGTDMVSKADLEAEAAIRKVLAERRPNDLMLGEEGGLVHADGTPLTDSKPAQDGDSHGADAVLAARDAAREDLVWICDPLDGTTNFLYGLRAWCVSVAVRDAGGVIAGIVVDPLAGETFIAARGQVALLVERGGAVTPLPTVAERSVPPLERALIGTGFAYDPDVRAHQAEVLASYAHRVRDVRRTGAAALDLCWVAAGRLDAYYERTVRPWDVAAGALLCEAVGLELRFLPPLDGGIPGGVLAAPSPLVNDVWQLASGGADPVPGVLLDLVA